MPRIPRTSTVSPCYLSIAPLSRQQGGDRGRGGELTDAQLDLAQPGDMVFGDPIVGRLPADPTETQVRALESPKPMTAE